MSQVIYVVTDSRFILPGVPELCTKKSSLLLWGIPPHLLLYPLHRTALRT